MRRRLNNASVLDFVELYMTEGTLNHTVNETNWYSKQYLDETIDQTENSYHRNWHSANILGIKTFLGLTVLIEIIYKPNIVMYSLTHHLYYNPFFKSCDLWQILFISKVFAFQQIFRLLIQTAFTKIFHFSKQFKNVAVNLTTLENIWVLTNGLYYSKVVCISSSI